MAKMIDFNRAYLLSKIKYLQKCLKTAQSSYKAEIKEKILELRKKLQ